MSYRASLPRADDRNLRTAHAKDLELDQVRAALNGIRHGEIRVVIQDGLIVQIDRLEKQRFR